MGLRRRITELVNDVTLSRGFDAMVAVSHDIERRMRSKFRRTRVLCIHNGIETQVATPRAAASGDSLRLLAMGRLVPVKRFDRLRPIADALHGLGMRPVITLAGEGPLLQELERELRPGDAASGIRMPGFVAQPATLFDESDALLITSDHEGIPMVALEALSRGIPVFGFAVGGLPEIAATPVPMQLVAPGDVVAMAQAICGYFAGQRGQALRPPADWKFSIEHCAGEYENLYASVAGGSADSSQS
jgi:glycosyltransferase involved in cell wall biosynthesis